jgi:glycosyltransferase involved in cell wall biosynthesis
LFSVLIANYNNSKYLYECYMSVKNQTYANWEIVIVDDCSTEDTTDIYTLLEQDSRVKVYKNDINNKTAFTFKRALDLSKGEICGFLGPDDSLAETAIEKCVYEHLRLVNCSIVYTLNILCDEQMNVVGEFKWGGKLQNNRSQLTSKAGNKITSFISFKKEMYDKTSGIDTKFVRGFDQDFCYKLEEVGEVHCIEEVLYNYRQHSNNISLNENNIKAWYWLHVANTDAYHRRKEKKSDIDNLKKSDLKNGYIKVCLLKVDQKIRLKNYNNICFYYYQLLKNIPYDRNLLIARIHIIFFKRELLKIFKGKNYDRIYFSNY